MAKKSDNKTKPTAVSVDEYIAGLPEKRQADARVLREMMERVTGEPAAMWGPSIVGFDTYHYRYESGREGDFMQTGFAARKANLVVYILPGYQDFDAELARLGKHKIGKSCLYINKLADVDLEVLEGMVKKGVEVIRERYG